MWVSTYLLRGKKGAKIGGNARCPAYRAPNFRAKIYVIWMVMYVPSGGVGGFAALKWSISKLKRALMADVLVRTRVVRGQLASGTVSKSSSNSRSSSEVSFISSGLKRK